VNNDPVVSVPPEGLRGVKRQALSDVWLLFYLGKPSAIHPANNHTVIEAGVEGYSFKIVGYC